MSKQVQLRRGTTAQHATFTGAAGEVTYDTDRKCLVVHDGVTAGGLPLTGYLVLDPEGSGTAQTVDSPIEITGKNVGDGGVMLYAGLTEIYDIGLSTGRLGFVYPVRNWNGVAYAAVLAVSCKLSEWQYLVLAGDVDLSASDLERGGHLVLRIDADGSRAESDLSRGLAVAGRQAGDDRGEQDRAARAVVVGWDGRRRAGAVDGGGVIMTNTLAQADWVGRGGPRRRHE